MSKFDKKCSKCKNYNVNILICESCAHYNPKPTVFEHITESVETLAKNLVYCEDIMGVVYWFSTILPKERAFFTESRAFAATAAELKKETKEQSK